MSKFQAEALGTRHNRGKVRSVVTAFALLLGANVGMSTVEAQGPVTVSNPINRTFETECPQGFTLTETYTGTETTRHFSDGRQQTQVKLSSEFSNSVSGETLESTTPFMITFDSGEVAIVGITSRVGNESINTGRTLQDQETGLVISDAGPNDPIPNLCGALS